MNTLAKAGAKFNTFDLAAHLSRRMGLPRPVAEGVIQVLASIYLAREAQGIPLEMFLDEQVRPALKTALVEGKAGAKGKSGANASLRSEDAEARWAKLRDFFMATLVLDDTVGVAAKAGPVLTDHERIFVDAKILTDIRPIFHPDPSEKPNAAVIVHMLRITTRDILGSQKAQYFALDANDIRFIKHLLDRAIKKEETLNSLLDTSGVTVIAPKEIF